MDKNIIKSGIEKEAIFEYARSSGPGGQNVNKLNTKARIRWDFKNSNLIDEFQKQLIKTRLKNKITSTGELIIESQKTRSQQQNKENALEQITELVNKALIKIKARKPIKISKAVKERRLEQKKKHSLKKQLRVKIKY